jgi:hypothetical protein
VAWAISLLLVKAAWAVVVSPGAMGMLSPGGVQVMTGFRLSPIAWSVPCCGSAAIASGAASVTHTDSASSRLRRAPNLLMGDPPLDELSTCRQASADYNE